MDWDTYLGGWRAVDMAMNPFNYVGAAVGSAAQNAYDAGDATAQKAASASGIAEYVKTGKISPAKDKPTEATLDAELSANASEKATEDDGYSTAAKVAAGVGAAAVLGGGAALATGLIGGKKRRRK